MNTEVINLIVNVISAVGTIALGALTWYQNRRLDFIIWIQAILGRCEDDSEIGSKLRCIRSLKDIELKFVLVIKMLLILDCLPDRQQN